MIESHVDVYRRAHQLCNEHQSAPRF
jgi:hypothetical protein